MIRQVTKGKVINKELRYSVFEDHSHKKTMKITYWVKFRPFELPGRYIIREVDKESWYELKYDEEHVFPLHSNGDQVIDTGMRY